MNLETLYSPGFGFVIHSFSHSLIHSFILYLLGTYQVPEMNKYSNTSFGGTLLLLSHSAMMHTPKLNESKFILL